MQQQYYQSFLTQLDHFAEILCQNNEWISRLGKNELAALSQQKPDYGSDFLGLGGLGGLGGDVFMRLLTDARTTLGLFAEGMAQNSGASGPALLEIGGGLGLTYAVMKNLGFNIVAIEPSGSGHEDYYVLGLAMMQILDIDSTGWLPIGATQLGRLRQKFDLIVSNNVLEHIEDLPQAFASICHMLRDANSKMIHNCPNYLVPYEPHYSLVLVPLAPKLIEWFNPKLKHQGLWQSLNFITSITLVKLARQNGLQLRFDNHHLLRTLDRLSTDPLFKSKHRGVAVIYQLLKTLGVLPLLRLIPGWLVTPIQFTGSFKQAS